MQAGSSEDVLARLFVLADSPLAPESPAVRKDDIQAFLTSCKDPASGQLNIDVVESLLPQAWREVAVDSPQDTEDAQMVLDEEVADDQALPEVPVQEEAVPTGPERPERAYIVPDRLPEAAAHDHYSLTELKYNVQARPLFKYIVQGHKTLPTSAYNLCLLEGRIGIVWDRIEELKRHNKWSLRQLKRFEGPARAKCHWDYVVAEALAKRSQMVATRRHKMALCHQLSQTIISGTNGETLPHVAGSFSLQDGALPLIVQQSQLSRLSREVLEAVPAGAPLADDSYAEPLGLVMGALPCSRFLNTSDPNSWRHVVWENIPEDRSALYVTDELKAKAPLNFRPREAEIKPPRPPPKELMAVRLGSVWQPAEDEALMRLASRFNNNWELIADQLQGGELTPAVGPAGATSAYTSNVERRTAWQVFERWLQLSGTDVKDLKGRYAEATRQSLEAAQKLPQTTRKRQMPLSIAPDAFQRGHRRLRWASVLEGIRKAKRKRETTPKPSTQPFPYRRQNEVGGARASQPVQSAVELSRIKGDRDRAIQEQITQQRLASHQAQARNAYAQRALHGGATPSASAGTPAGTLAAGVSGASAPSSANASSSAGSSHVGSPMLGSSSRDSSRGDDLARRESAASRPSVSAGSPNTPTMVRPGSRSPINAVPPSIAGLPLPPSVAAVAAARQKQLQQQQKQQQQQQQQQQAQQQQQQQQQQQEQPQPQPQPSQQPSQQQSQSQSQQKQQQEQQHEPRSSQPVQSQQQSQSQQQTPQPQHRQSSPQVQKPQLQLQHQLQRQQQQAEKISREQQPLSQTEQQAAMMAAHAQSQSPVPQIIPGMSPPMPPGPPIQALPPHLEARRRPAQHILRQRAQMHAFQMQRAQQAQQVHQAQHAPQSQPPMAQTPQSRASTPQQVHAGHPQQVPFTHAQIQGLMAQIAHRHPALSPQEVQHIAIQQVRRYMQAQRQRQQDQQAQAMRMRRS